MSKELSNLHPDMRSLILASQVCGTEDVEGLLTKGLSELHVACKLGLQELVSTLLKDDPSPVNYMALGRTPLHIACTESNLEIVQKLVECGACVNLGTKLRETPLWFAAEHGHTHIIQYLIEKGADPHAPTLRWGFTPIIAAVMNGHTGTVECLLKAGCSTNVNSHDSTGYTPLHRAVMKGHTQVVKTLLEYGADVNLPTTHGTLYPITVATQSGHKEMLQIIIEHGANVNVSSRMGPPVRISIKENNAEILQCLIDAGANVDTCGAIHAVIGSRQPSLTMAKMLIRGGCDLHSTHSSGVLGSSSFTPLEVAVIEQELRQVDILLDADGLIHKSVWDMVKNTPHLILNDSLIGVINEYISTPLSLKRLCRALIKSAVGHGCGYSRKLALLNLPKPLVSFLQFHHIR